MADQQIAWLGLGNMGRGMCVNLVKKGGLSKPLIVQNRTRTRSDKMVADLGHEKVEAVDTPDEAVKRSDIIFTCLGDDAAIEATLHSATSVDITGKLFVECSTVSPETTNALAKHITEKGGHFVASPVFGAPVVADAGMLLFVLAGAKADVEKVIPFTKGVMGKAYIELGENYGKAASLKIIGNSFVMSFIEGIAEAHVLSEKSGLGTDAFHQFLVANFSQGPFVSYSERMISGDYHKREEPLFAVDLARKDSSHMLHMAKQCGCQMGNVRVIDGHFAEIQKQMGSKGDITGCYGAARVEAGLPFKN